jgi:hypothetical protein
MKALLFTIALVATASLTGCVGSCPSCSKSTAEAPTPAAAPSAAPTAAPAKVSINLSGDWDWTCCDGKYHGTMTLKQDGNTLTGRLFDENDTVGGALIGSVDGTVVKFNRKWAEDSSQDYTLTASADGKKLEGDFDGTKDDSVGAHFSTTKK